MNTYSATQHNGSFFLLPSLQLVGGERDGIRVRGVVLSWMWFSLRWARTRFDVEVMKKHIELAQQELRRAAQFQPDENTPDE